jgi:L-ascorbate metabolism protein UlaG (beta-lactamase superfamily)
MIITYQGAEFFKVQFGDIVIAFNPISNESKLKSARFFADIAIVSTNHSDFNGVDNLSYNGKNPFIISGPGEYETKGVFIKGYPTKTTYDLDSSKEKTVSKINTIYSVLLEGINLCFLGALSDEKVSIEFLESVENIDILFLPIGDNGVLDAKQANKLAVSLNPKIIIPMHYGSIGISDALKVFLKEAGEESIEPIDKLTIKKKDLDGKENKVIVLSQIN